MLQKTNERLLAIMSVFLLIFTQVITPITVLAQGTDESAGLNEELYEVNVEQEGSNNISLEQKSSHKITKLNIELSEGTTIDKQKLEQELSSDSKINYEEDKHIINIESEKGINKKMLLKFSKNDSNNFWIHLEAFENDLRVTDEKHDLKFEQKVVSQRDEAKTRQSDIISPRVGDLNTDISISPYKKTVESGNSAMYKLILKTTGSQKEYVNSKLEVDLPINEYTEFTQDLNELKIAGVAPTYDSSKHKLYYEFGDKLRSGETYEKIIKVDTKNLITPNGERLKSVATINTTKESFTDEAEVKVNASGDVVVSKKFKEARLGGAVKLAPFPGSYTIWDIKINIPKKDIGQMYLKEGSKIVIEDTFSKGLEYYDVMDGTPKPTVSGNTLKWELDVPSLEEQETAKGNFVTIDLRVRLKVLNDKKLVNTQLKNDVKVHATFIDNKRLDPPAKDSAGVGVFDSDSLTGDIEGMNYMTPVHLGAFDGNGQLTGHSKKDPNPTVFDDAYLGFAHGIAATRVVGHYDAKKYQTIYKIDPNLNLDKIKTPGGEWLFARNNPEAELKIPLAEKPRYNIVFKIKGKPDIVIENAKDNHVYTRADIGLKPTDKVTSIVYDFTYAPAGMFSAGAGENRYAKYYFYPEKGFVGKVKNEFNLEIDPDKRAIKEWNDYIDKNPQKGLKIGSRDKWWYKHNIKDQWDELASDRHATIVSRPAKEPPIASVGVELLDQSGGEVIRDDNRLRVTLKNEKSSTVTMTEKLESLVLLPPGVKTKDDANPSFTDNDGKLTSGKFEVVDENYNQTGRQLVKVIWDVDRIRVGSELTAEFDLEILETAPTTLKFDVYGFSGDNILKVPATTNNSIKDTILQTDEDDLNGDGVTDQPRIKSGNIYTIRGLYDLQTEKFVKGELDEDWNTLGQTTPGGNIDYKLHLTNTTGKDISKMTLIDVLPSVGDLGITDNISRGSKFTPTMKGPIQLPKEWENKVKVFYSEEKTPKRDDLIRYTEYPDTTEKLSNPPQAKDPNWKSEQAVTDWSKIHSFKIELIESEDWLTGVDMEVLFSMKAPEANEVDKALLDKDIKPLERATCNSFAVATEHGQPVEPAQVCAYMNYEVEEPELEKTVNEQKDVYDLINKDETFTWEVSYEFGNYTGDWESVVLSDEINELLTIEEVIVIDQNGQDVTGNGKLTTDDNLVKFELLKKDGNFSYLENQTYQLIIKSKISEETSDKDLLPYINDSGIPNQAELIINDNPKPSNEVSVKPPELSGSLSVIKVDGETDEKLAGAEFELRDLEGKVVATGVTDKNGSFTMQDLKLGKYELFETKAPKGYRLLKKPIDVEITADELHLELKVENSKSDWELPSTAGIGTLIFYLTGLVLVLASLLSILKNKRRTV